MNGLAKFLMMMMMMMGLEAMSQPRFGKGVSYFDGHVVRLGRSCCGGREVKCVDLHNAPI